MRSTILILPLLIVGCAVPTPPSALHPERSELKIGEVSGVKSISAHAVDTFRLDLDSGALVFGNVNQLSFDAVVEVINPAKERIASFDGPSTGPEAFRFRSRSNGIHKIVVFPFEDQKGDYTITLAGAEPIATTAEGTADQFVRILFGNDSLAPGTAVAVQKDGKITFSKGYGYADLESRRKITPTTIFHVASVSKQFTAFAIAMLADQGKLSLNDDIRKYLPELNDFEQVITINHLVHHTSGLRDQWNLLMMAGWRLDDVITQKQIMRVISRQKELNFKPGEEYLYCNTGFTLMGEIVKRVTGQTLNEWTKANVFDPLGMNDTFFYDDHERVVINRAYSYYKDGKTGAYKKSVLSYANAGATSLFTTVLDLNKWAENFEKMKVGNPKVMEMMNQKFILNKGDTINYAFGQSLDKYRGIDIITHSGGDAGFRSYLLRIPDQHLFIAVTSNYAQFGPGGMAFGLTDVLASGLEPVKFTPLPPREGPKADAFDPKTLKLSDYIGSYYSDELETRYRFDIANDTLLSHHQRHDDFKLIPVDMDKFSMNFLGEVVFTRNKAGKVDGFKASNGRVRNLVFRSEK